MALPVPRFAVPGIVFATGCLCLGTPLLVAQERPEETGTHLSPEHARAVDSIFSSFDNTNSPGCALGILEGGQLTFARGYGMANLDYGIAITPRTIFRTGSVSKQFTAAVVALLAREGAFSLDDDLRLHFPELPEYEAPVTIRHLLNHTSGIRDYLELMGMRGVGDEATYTEDDVVDLLARQKALNFPPGSEFLYSNSGYVLLSRLVERTTGLTLREQAERLLFQPLGMPITHYHDNHREVVPYRATGYGLGPSGDFVVDQTTLDIIGDGGVFTSVEELSRWMANFWTLQVGGEDWLSTLEQRGVLTSGDTLSYAMGLRHGNHRGLHYVGHGGAFVGYRAATLRYPDYHVGIMVLCNYARTNPMELAMEVGEVLLEDGMDPPVEGPSGEPPASPAPPPAPLSPEEEASFLGEYYSEEVDATFRVVPGQGEEGFLLDVNGSRELPLRLVGPDRFRAEYLVLAFQRQGGRVTGFRAGSGRVEGVLFVRR